MKPKMDEMNADRPAPFRGRSSAAAKSRLSHRFHQGAILQRALLLPSLALLGFSLLLWPSRLAEGLAAATPTPQDTAGDTTRHAGAGNPAGHAAAAPFDAELTPALRESIDRGLRWLDANQAEDGSYGLLSHYGPHVGITGLAGMAFIMDGNVPGRGRYGHNVEQCIDFIIAHSSESGLLAAETSHGPMYDHGFAALFLAEAYGMSPRPDLREALRKAVRLIVSTQNDEGGWRYQPERNDADISVTICEIMALRAARDAGIYVDKSVIDKAVEYVKRSQNPDGGFRYMLGSGGSAFARSAAGVAALQYAGIYQGEEIEQGLAYIERFIPSGRETVGHYFYGHYYAAQAMYLAGDRYWSRWWPAIREELLGKQADDGSWRGQAGTEYGTAMALIILEIPNRLLPIFQK